MHTALRHGLVISLTLCASALSSAYADTEVVEGETHQLQVAPWVSGWGRMLVTITDDGPGKGTEEVVHNKTPTGLEVSYHRNVGRSFAVGVRARGHWRFPHDGCDSRSVGLEVPLFLRYTERFGSWSWYTDGGAGLVAGIVDLPFGCSYRGLGWTGELGLGGERALSEHWAVFTRVSVQWVMYWGEREPDNASIRDLRVPNVAVGVAWRR